MTRRLLTAVIIIVILVMAFITKPSDQRHREELRGAVAEMVRQKGMEKLNEKDDKVTKALGRLLLGSDGLMNTAVNAFVSVKIDDYVFFSLGKVKTIDSDDYKTASIALFGQVYSFLWLADYFGKDLN